MRYSLYLQNYQFSVKHISGSKNTAADALSRLDNLPVSPTDDSDNDIYDEIAALTPSGLSPQTAQAPKLNDSTFNEPLSRTQTQTQSEKETETFDVVQNTPPEGATNTFLYQSNNEFMFKQIAALNNSSDSNETKTILHIEYGDSETTIIHTKEPEEMQILTAIDNLGDLQRNCPNLKPYIEYIESNILPADEKQAKRIIWECNAYFFKNGILYHQFEPRNKNIAKLTPVVKQIAVPLCLRNMVLKNAHDNKGHIGIEKCFHTIKQTYSWPSLYRDVCRYVKTCVACQKAKRNYHATKPKLQPLPVGEVFESISMDVLGAISPPNPDGTKFVLVVIDSFSHWPESFCIKDQSAETIADVLFREIFCRFGCCKKLLSDRGTSFLSSLVKSLCKLLNIKSVY